jgi:hypothetical protein
MQEIVYLELKLRDKDFLPAEFILELDEFILKLNSHFSFVIQIIFVLFLGLLKLFPLIFEHKLNLAEILLINVTII